MQAIHERLHQPDALFVAGVDHPPRVLGSERQWFLTQNVLSRRGGRDRPLGMEVIGQGDVNGVDVRIREQGLVRSMPSGYAELFSHYPGSVRSARRYGDDLTPVGLSHARDDFLASDPGG